MLKIKIMADKSLQKKYLFKKLNDELSIVQDKKTDLYGLYNKKKQKFDIPLIYDYMDADLSESQLILTLNKDGYYGYLDKNNKIMLPFQYDEAGVFSSGSAYVSKFIGQNNIEYGVIDEKGNFILPIEYNSIHIYNKECVIVKKNNHYGIITLNKKIILPLEYDYIEDFGWISEGLFSCTKSEKIGIFDIDTQKFIYPVELDYVEYYLMNSHQEYHILGKNDLNALIKIENNEIIFITDYIYEYID